MLTNDFDNPVERFGTMGCRTMLGYDINGLGNILTQARLASLSK